MTIFSDNCARFLQKMARRVCHIAPLFLLVACAGAIPTQDEIRDDNKSAKASQIMRVAETTARGGDLTAAAGLFRRASILSPDDPAPLIKLGLTLSAAKAYRDAAEAFRDALAIPQIPPEDEAKARYGYGRVLISMDRPELAVPEFKAVLATRPGDAALLNILGVALDLTGHHAQAQDRYRQSLENRPDVASVRNNLGLSLALSGAYDDAIKTLTILAKDPIAENRHKLNLALVYGLAGRVEDATRAMSRLLTSEQIKSNLATYENLRALTPEERAKVVFGFK